MGRILHDTPGCCLRAGKMACRSASVVGSLASRHFDETSRRAVDWEMLQARDPGRDVTRSTRRWGVVVGIALLWAAAGLVALRLSRGAGPGAAPVREPLPKGTAPRLGSLGPRLTSNETSQPLSVHGENLVPGLRLSLGPPLSLELPLTVVDPGHAFARLPAHVALPENMSEALVQAWLVAPEGRPAPEGRATLTVVNDAAFPDLTTMVASPDGRTLFILAPSMDTVFALDVASGRVARRAVGDGPSALATWKDARGHAWLGVVHRFQAELRVYSLETDAPPRVLPAPAGATGLEVDGARGVAFIAEHVEDRVHAVSLEDGRERWASGVDPNPRALARWKDLLAVGSLQTGQLELLRQSDGVRVSTVVPGPGVAIVGGYTERFRAQVMGGKAPRALVASEKLGRVFMASLGPNVGPNPQRMEPTNNGGVAVVDPARGEYVRHRGFGAGVTEGLALDEDAGLLYAADVGIGRVRVLDARALMAASDEAARGAVLQELAMPPLEDMPRVRPAEDFLKKGRAGEELHSGPRAVVLSPDARTLYVLNRFTRAVAVVDVRDARAGQARLVRQLPVVESRAQVKRRLGQVLYYADLGRTGITCDGCHIEGHMGGVFYEKTTPNRVYRSPTVLGSRDTPPYFTPASNRNLLETARHVGGRNRFHNPDPSDEEVEALAFFSSLLSTPPNPFRGEDGAPLQEVTLPDGHKGMPARGRALFEGQGNCTKCHPAPLYALDQDPATRSQFHDVGTPLALPLRTEYQDLVPGVAAPSLAGAWDVWPMLTSATAGYGVKDGHLVVETRFPLRAVLETAGPKHGGASTLSPAERDDLLAFLLTL
ncbi:MtsA protein [Myxococcus stipitatus]|uniref:MtsA protein n=1 Tax=Myxococcus stipitatus TaxID=83455 RepID=UPI001F3E3762|nr:MtsA protein [Myxococcus stipitatus]MCE9669397.1 MtsA protein [Myxococcus stipitatus]